MAKKGQADWERKQKHAFTEWINYRMEMAAEEPISDMYTDLTDGVVLVKLLQVLVGKKIGRYNKKPKMKIQKIENINLVLKYIRNDGIRIENMGGEDIESGNPTITMGLIWTLILHYQIASVSGSSSAQEAKNDLLEWVRGRCKPFGVPVDNFTSSFRDGKAFGALVASFTGNVNFNEDIGDNAAKNMDIAFAAADEDLHIPQLLKSGDIANSDHIDDKSIMTYCALFYDKYGGIGADEMIVETPKTDPLQTICYGPGLEGGKAGKPLEFTIEARDKNGVQQPFGGDDCEVMIVTDDGTIIPCIVEDKGDGTYVCKYTPEISGNLCVQVSINGDAVKDDPFNVAIAPKFGPTEPGKSTAYGLGLEGGKCDRVNKFTIEARDSEGNRNPKGGDKCEVVVIGPDGKEGTANIVDNDDGTYSVDYKPWAPGVYKITPKLNNQLLVCGVVDVEIRELTLEEMECKGIEPEKCTAHGWGLRGGSIHSVGKFCAFTRDNRGCRLFEGGEKCTVTIKDPSGKPITATIVDNDDSTYNVEYLPTKAGAYLIEVKFNDKQIKRSPFKVTLRDLTDDERNSGTSPAHSYAYGKGLEGKTAIQNLSALDSNNGQFTIVARDMNGEQMRRGGDKAKVIVTTPNGKKFEASVKDNKDGTYSVDYPAADFGDYKIDVSLNGKPVGSGTYHKNYHRVVAVGEVACSGEALSKGYVDYTNTFSVETKDLEGITTPINPSRMLAVIKDPEGNNIPTEITSNDDGTYDIHYEPEVVGNHTIEVYVDGKLMDGPYTTEVTEKQDEFALQRGDVYQINSQRIICGLGWTTVSGKPLDLDASCIMTRFFRKLDHCYFKDRSSKCGSVVHSGDKITGGTGKDDDEQIKVNLDTVPNKINTLIFTVNVWNGTFADVATSFVRIIDDDKGPNRGKDLCRFTLDDIHDGNGLIMCTVNRETTDKWTLKAVGQRAPGRTFDQLFTKESMGPHLTKTIPMRTFEIRLHEGKGLAADPKDGSCNALVEVKYDMDTVKSIVIPNERAPKFNQTLCVKGQSDVIGINIYHQVKKKLEFLGRASIPVARHEKDDGKPIIKQPKWYPLEGRHRSSDLHRPQGKIKLTVVQRVAAGSTTQLK